MFRKILITVVALALVGAVGFGILAWRPAIASIPVPSPASFSQAQVERGAVLASAGYCSTCHTVGGGQPFAGGYAMRTPFGTIYSTNITPDPKTGIGDWSEAAFARAMREGVARDGSHLLPAFPYDHFTKLSDEDIGALYAFLMTRKPVEAEAPSNSFPLNIRFVQAGWKLLFFRPGRFAPQPAHDEEWNRGAYLAESLSHCSACHTPRNLFGAEDSGRRYAGASIDNWFAPPLDASDPTPMPWTKDELIAYLSTGVSQFHGSAAGPMAPAVHGLVKLPPSDIAAIAAYFADLNGSSRRQVKPETIVSAALASEHKGTGLTYDPAARLYTAACASCHYNGADQVNALRPELALNSAINLDDPTNLIQVITHGISAKDGIPGVVMPGFKWFSDADVVRIASYLRTTRTNKPVWPDLEKKVAAVREQRAEEE